MQPREERVPHGVAGLALHWPACVVFPLLCLLAPSVRAQASGLQRGLMYDPDLRGPWIYACSGTVTQAKPRRGQRETGDESALGGHENEL